MRILVVEDEIRLASLMRKGLRREGFLADVAIKGEDALWMAEASGYDVLVLDIALPGIDGIEVCRRLRADRVGTPILMLTARDAIMTASPGSTREPTTTWSSHSTSASCWRASARSGGGARPRRAPCSASPTWSSTRRGTECAGAARRSR